MTALVTLIAALWMLVSAALAPALAIYAAGPYSVPLPPPVEQSASAHEAHAVDLSAFEVPIGGCGLYAGRQVPDAEVLEAIERYDWSPHGAETILELFRRESSLYEAAENLCTDDHGVPQINRRYHGDWCDVELAKREVSYAIWCASRIYERQGISAWIAAEGWLW